MIDLTPLTSSYELDLSYKDNLTTVALVDKTTGLRARGHALCDVYDNYDPNFGTNLAYIRATERLFKKLNKWYSRGVSVFEGEEPR